MTAASAGDTGGPDAMTHDAIAHYLVSAFPQVFTAHAIELTAADGGTATLTLTPGEQHLRPGGVISGPTLMMLADAAAYAALLSVSAAAKMAVTSNLNISFLRGAPAGGAIVQHATVVKRGRRLSVIVCEAETAEGTLIAHTTTTYAMPAA
ncbi:PaaI family thioesterase [Acuticoccus sp. MNP-M23]|uniref:PaaI family thioesterase n=1 Tax=Acuticoccus sp. MNP-M23 TaxID=3072793 RepID=UPI002815FBD9|nr:PaaI family thioesterase [Acuticoccus sp. MNP-M23]WMS42129.1 PaaI family thioesterase [Acuticoccus sp. MNP-M23]